MPRRTEQAVRNSQERRVLRVRRRADADPRACECTWHTVRGGSGRVRDPREQRAHECACRWWESCPCEKELNALVAVCEHAAARQGCAAAAANC